MKLVTFLLSSLCVLTSANVFQPRKPLREFSISLDDAPEVRFRAVNTAFNATIWEFYNQYLADDKTLQKFTEDVSSKRGPEPDSELWREIQGISADTKIPLSTIHTMAMSYELTAIFIPPIHNITTVDPKLLQPLADYGIDVPTSPVHWPWGTPGCTGILGVTADGSVTHARNLDFEPPKYMQALTYSAIFTKGGQEVFRAQMVGGYSLVVTGMRSGKNGWSYETNTRFPDHTQAIKEVFDNLFENKRTLNGWTVRKALATTPNFEDAIATFSTEPYVAGMYNIVGGVRKGTILCRDPSNLAYQFSLGQKNFECRDDYIIMTNFDYFWNDVREWFDPTGSYGKGFGKPRRLAAQKVLNATAQGHLTDDVMFSAINSLGDLSFTTIFQALMNVEKGTYNISLPQLPGN